MASSFGYKKNLLQRILSCMRGKTKVVQTQERPKGYNPQVLLSDTSDGKYKCSDCHWILRLPYQSFCGHRYCKDCFNYITSNRSGEPVKCQLCIEEGTESEFTILKANQAFPDNGIKREVDTLDARCVYSGCVWTGSFKEYQEHEVVCEYKLIQCSQCGGQLKPSEQVRHNEELCPSTPAQCPDCSLSSTRGIIQLHYCPNLLSTCPGCKQKLSRMDMLDHAASDHVTCPDAHIVCLFGCSELIRPANLREHVLENLDSHLGDMNSRLAAMDDQMRDVRSQSAAAQQGENFVTTAPPVAQTLPGSSDSGVNVFSQLRLDMSGLQQQISDIVAQITTPSTRNIPTGGAMATNTNQENQAVDVVDQKIMVLERVLAVFKREIERINSQHEEVVRSNQESKDRIETLTRQVTAQERIVNTHKTTIVDLQQRLMVSEASSNDGILIWKINNFSQRREDARAGRVVSFYSPAFFTSRTGYKACARIYLNGDGMGKTTHVSLFFVLMRGEFDALLPWPFQQKVSLIWVDQTKKENIIDTFRPDPTSSSFRRPTSDMNVASGCPLFMPLTTLDVPGQGYVKEDIAFIKIIIDKSNLNSL